MDTKKLRQKILDLAIRGKLVPQDPNDEPASVLLERIRTEKERLIAEGKIKRPKKSKASSSESHYQQLFQLPHNWEWIELGEFTYDLQYGTSERSLSKGDVSVLRMGNLTRIGTIDYSNLVYTCNQADIEKYELQEGDLLFNRTNSSEWVGKTSLYDGKIPAIYAGYLIKIRTIAIDSKFLCMYMCSKYYRDWCLQVKTDAVNQSNINAQKLSKLYCPIPPLKEQRRIVSAFNNMIAILSQIEFSKSILLSTITYTKSKILELAMQGKLVPQDLTDEHAAEMLKRINPKAKIITDNPHYPKLPDNWVITQLEDITDYEQPQPYIVSSTDYSDDYATPVLTAGKSFILGYTNEDTAIFKKVPVIIFDDFTTDSHYVDFPFKVKSSAMKIISVKNGINIEYVSYFMSMTRLVGDTHKRYWISEYCKLPIPLPPLEEQNRIVSRIKEIYSTLEIISSCLNAQ